MAHPDVLMALQQNTQALTPLTFDELTVLAEALREYQLRVPIESGRRVIADALTRRCERLLL